MILKLGGFCEDVGVEIGCLELHSYCDVFIKFPLDWSLCE